MQFKVSTLGLKSVKPSRANSCGISALSDLTRLCLRNSRASIYPSGAPMMLNLQDGVIDEFLGNDADCPFLLN